MAVEIICENTKIKEEKFAFDDRRFLNVTISYIYETKTNGEVTYPHLIDTYPEGWMFYIF